MQFKHVETRCSEEITQVGYGTNPTPQPARLQVELGLIVRIDEIKTAVKDAERRVLNHTLKFLNRTFAAFDIHKVIDTVLALLEEFKDKTVQEPGQQVYPWQM